MFKNSKKKCCDPLNGHKKPILSSLVPITPFIEGKFNLTKNNFICSNCLYNHCSKKKKKKKMESHEELEDQKDHSSDNNLYYNQMQCQYQQYSKKTASTKRSSQKKGSHSVLEKEICFSKIKSISLSIYLKSPRGYRYLRKVLKLPSVDTLKRYLNRVSIEPGLSNQLLMNFSSVTSKLKEIDKIVVLMIDEIH
ncbi:hypothetical protein Avbf_11389 [Armadillidium vulgare]|nr:hypothetical protein Avbf_11389 [Armadillidium vulgare]